MSLLLEKLKQRFKTPQAALQALGLDAALIIKDEVKHDPSAMLSQHIDQPGLLQRRREGYNLGKGRDSAMAGDSKESNMPKTRYSPTALVAMGALQTYLAPRLALDATISLPILRTLDHKNFKAEIPNVVKQIKLASKGKLAQDADVEDVAEVLEAIGGIDPAMLAEQAQEQDTPVEGNPDKDTPAVEGEPDAPLHEEPDGDEDPAMMAKVREWLKDKVPPETMAEFDEMIGEQARDEVDTDVPSEHDKDPAKDENPDDDAMDNDIPGAPDFKGAPKVGGGMNKQAMDAAIKPIVDAAVAAERKNQTDIRNAFAFVRPWVGELAMDASTPHDVYRAALRARGVDVKVLPDAALKPVLEAQPRAGAKQQRQIASDARGGKTPSFTEMFPSAARIGHA